MEMQEAFTHLIWIAIFVAAVSTYIIGGCRYSLFENQWMATNNFTKEYLQQRNLPLAFGLSVLFSFIISFNLAMFIGTKADV